MKQTIPSSKTSQIIEYLQTCPGGMTMSDLARITGFSRNTVAKYLDRLYHAGLVEMQSVGPAKYYTIAEAANLLKLAERLPGPVIIINSTYEIRFYNEACQPVLDLKSDTNKPVKTHLDIPGIPGKGIISETLAGSYQTCESRFQGRDKTITFHTTCIPVTLEKGERGALFYISYPDDLYQQESRSCPQIITDVLSSIDFPAIICKTEENGDPGEVVALTKTAAGILGIETQERIQEHIPGRLRITRSLESLISLSDANQKGYASTTLFICRSPQGDETILSLVISGISCQKGTYSILTVAQQEVKQRKPDSLLLISSIITRLISLLQEQTEKTEIWDDIVAVLQDSLPGSIVICNTSDENSNTWTCKSIAATYEQKAILQEILGVNPVGITYTLSDKKIAQILSQKAIPAMTGISASFFHAYPVDICQRLAQVLAVHICCIIPLLGTTQNPAFIGLLLPFHTTPMVQPAHFVDAVIPALQMACMNYTDHAKRLQAQRQHTAINTMMNATHEKMESMDREFNHTVTDLIRQIASHTHLLIDIIPLIRIPAVLVNRTGDVIQINHPALNLFHLRPEDIINTNWYDVVSSLTDENHLLPFHEQVLKGPQIGHLIMQSVRIDGRVREYLWTAQEVPLPEQRNTGVLWFGEEAPAQYLIRFSRGL